MMVQNSVEFDTRVRKEAESLASVGYEVRVLGRSAPHLPDLEVVEGVTYERVMLERGLSARLARMMGLFAIARGSAARPSAAGRGRLRWLESLAAGARFPSAFAARSDAALVAFIHKIDEAVAEQSARGRWVIYLLAPLVVVRRVAAVARGATTRASRLSRVAGALTRRRWRRGRRALLLGQRRVDRSLRLGLAPLSLHLDWAASVAPRLERFGPDVVHAHDLNTLLAGWWHKRRHGCRLVYDAHELELHRNQEWTRYKRCVARAVELLGIRASDGVITVSPLIADDLARTYRIRRPVIVLNSPPLSTRGLEPAMDLRAEAGLDGAQQLTVYVGGVLFRRGHEQLVEALAHLDDGHHVGILGPRKPLREAPLVELAQRLGVEHRLHFFGAVPAHQVPATLARADATIIPIPNVCRSYDFALPNKLFDAVMAGVPIGVSRLRHMRDFVTEHELGLVVDETDPRSIARGLDQLVEAGRPGLADATRLERLQTQVAWEMQEIVLLALYRRVLGPMGIEPPTTVSAAVAPSSAG
jgi:glycosyltransferase involved in cell wall biosynthesis